MTPLRHSSRSPRAAALAALLLASCLAAGAGRAAAASHAPPTAPEPFDFGQQLADARTESDAAEAALEAAKRVLTPGHLLDPLPTRLTTGLGELQAEYAEMERKAAGYRTTLGDQHPTLRGAEDVLAELRRQIVDGARRAVATAQQDATRTRAAVATLERRARAADTTGSIVPSAPSAAPTRLPTVGSKGITETQAATVPPGSREIPRELSQVPRAAPDATMGRSLSRTLAEALPLALRHPWIAAAAGMLAGGAALVMLALLIRPRRRRSPALAPIRIEPAAPLEPVPVAHRSEPPPSTVQPSVAAVPVLATLPLEAGDDPVAIRSRLDRQPDAALARAATSVFATLAAAADGEPGSRVSVVVTASAGADDAQADAAALVLAAAAADTGRRVLVIDNHPDSRLGRSLAPTAAPIAVAERSGRLCSVHRVAIGGRTMALLSGEAGRSAEPSPARLPNLDGFDTIVIVGDLDGTADVSAGLALVVAPCGAAQEDLAAAARIAAGAGERPCGVLLIEIATSEAVTMEAVTMEAVTMEARTIDASIDAPIVEPAEAQWPTEPFPARRRGGSEAAIARVGLRRTFDPVRRAAKRAG